RRAGGARLPGGARNLKTQVPAEKTLRGGPRVPVSPLFPAVLAFRVARVIQRRQYALVTSSSRPLVLEPHPWKDHSLLLYCGLLAGFMVAVYAVILVSSLVQRWPYDFTLTFKHYYFDTAASFHALCNSIRVAALTSVA